MAQNQFSMDLNLKAYPNQLIPDVNGSRSHDLYSRKTPNLTFTCNHYFLLQHCRNISTYTKQLK